MIPLVARRQSYIRKLLLWISVLLLKDEQLFIFRVLHRFRFPCFLGKCCADFFIDWKSRVCLYQSWKTGSLCLFLVVFICTDGRKMETRCWLRLRGQFRMDRKARHVERPSMFDANVSDFKKLCFLRCSSVWQHNCLLASLSKYCMRTVSEFCLYSVEYLFLFN